MPLAMLLPPRGARPNVFLDLRAGGADRVDAAPIALNLLYPKIRLGVHLNPLVVTIS
jgi:hypothetical protein